MKQFDISYRSLPRGDRRMTSGQEVQKKVYESTKCREFPSNQLTDTDNRKV